MRCERFVLRAHLLDPNQGLEVPAVRVRSKYARKVRSTDTLNEFRDRSVREPLSHALWDIRLWQRDDPRDDGKSIGNFSRNDFLFGIALGALPRHERRNWTQKVVVCSVADDCPDGADNDKTRPQHSVLKDDLQAVFVMPKERLLESDGYVELLTIADVADVVRDRSRKAAWRSLR